MKSKVLHLKKGQDQAISKFVNDIKNLPNIPQEVYEAIKNDLKGVAKAVYEGVKQIPGEIIDTSKTIVKVNAVGEQVAEPFVVLDRRYDSK